MMVVIANHKLDFMSDGDHDESTSVYGSRNCFDRNNVLY
jgi:hypothetical protein